MIPGRTKAVQGCQAIIIAGEGAAAGAATAAILKELGFKKRIRQIEKDKVTSKLKFNKLQRVKCKSLSQRCPIIE